MNKQGLLLRNKQGLTVYKQSLLLRNKRIFVVHRWEGGPDKDWLPWVKRELSGKSYEVNLLSMPDPDYPKINIWVEYLRKEVGKPDENTILVGHSIGCQTILRYLETLPEDKKLDKVIFVAGWVSLTPLALRTTEEREIVKPWHETPIDFDKARLHANRFIAIFSDDDPYMPYEENAKTYKEGLGAEIILQKGMGHFTGDTGITELPIVLDSVLASDPAG